MKTDAELYAAAMAGGPEAFAPIVERYADAMFGVALARLGDFHDAQDVAQQALVEAFERLGGLKDPARLGAWLRSITIHRAIDHIRSKRPSWQVKADMQAAPTLTPHDQMERRELRERTLAAVVALGDTLRETTTLFYINGYSVDQVAGMLDVPLGTVKRRLHDARKKLQKEMMAMVEDTLKSESPREDIAEKVYAMLSCYSRPPMTQARWERVKDRLRAIGPEGIEGFIRALESPHSPTRRLALGMLTRTDQIQDTVEELLKRTTKDTNKKVRKAAFSALLGLAWQNEDRREALMPHILPALRDPSKKVRRLAWHLAHFPGFAQYVPLEEAAWAVAKETETGLVLRNQRDLLEAVLCVREGKENPHEKCY